MFSALLCVFCVFCVLLFSRIRPSRTPHARRGSVGAQTCRRRSVDEARSLFRCWNRATVVATEEAIANSRESVIRQIAQEARDDRRRSREMPWAAQVAGNSQRSTRPDVNSFPPGHRIGLDEHQRIDARDLGMPRDDLAGVVALQRRKTKRPLAIVAQNELHRAVAEAAQAVV